MKRLDWPDEPGWWWAIEKSVGRTTPYRFERTPNGELVTSYGFGRNDWFTKPEFEGPIPEPKVPVRFEIEGTMNPHEQFIGGTTVIYVAKNLIPDEAADKRFKITFEEIL